jgi:hypothetical protein
LDGKDYLVILGAPKCGTTSLSAWMQTWPGTVVARRKETLWFTDYAERSWAGPSGPGFADGAPRDPGGFSAQFAADPDAPLRVDASTDNLSAPGACDRIRAFADRPDVGRVRLVAVLRDPVDRIVSEFEHTLKIGLQGRNLMRSLQREDARRAAGWIPLFHHVARTRYHSGLAPFRAAFRDDLLIVDYHRLGERETRDRLARFAWQDPARLPGSLERHNVRKVYARPQFENALNRSPFARAVRLVVPKSLRPRLRALLRGPEMGRYMANERERRFILAALHDEIAACVADPDLPTDRWTCIQE